MGMHLLVSKEENGNRNKAYELQCSIVLALSHILVKVGEQE
jgi:hypothetical protein